ncbi:MAG: CBS domain-containing protein [Deltaproteobacteria bacterium]|nr:CBS domain-containing protein [Deltaproteobacteria bacterium]
MLVGRRMSRDVVTATPDDYLSTAQARMWLGGFRRIPVVEDGQLVGIVTDRDIKEHWGRLERTKISEVMTDNPLTVSPESTLEKAAQIMLEKKISGLPVLEQGRLVGIITTSDVVQAFLDVLGASVSGAPRIDLLLEGKGQDLSSASKTVAEEGAEILGLGTYRDRWGKSAVCYLRLRTEDPDRVADLLRRKGFNVLGVHP